MGTSIALYRLEGCPFCEFTVDKLDELDLEYNSVWVEGPQDGLKAITGQRQVPVVVDDGYGEADSPEEVESAH